MLILGISAFYHDSSVALIKDGLIVFAAQEERFSRKKHDNNFPVKSIQACLKYINLNINQIDFFSFYEKPTLKLYRLMDTYLSFSPSGYKSFHEAFSVWTRKKLFQKSIIISK